MCRLVIDAFGARTIQGPTQRLIIKRYTRIECICGVCVQYMCGCMYGWGDFI